MCIIINNALGGKKALHCNWKMQEFQLQVDLQQVTAWCLLCREALSVKGTVVITIISGAQHYYLQAATDLGLHCVRHCIISAWLSPAITLKKADTAGLTEPPENGGRCRR